MRRLSTTGTALLFVAAATLPVVPLQALPTDAATGAAAAVHAVTLIAAAVVFVRFGPREPALRSASRLFATALVIVATAFVIQVGYVVLTGSVPVPSVADPVALLWFPLVIWGLWGMPSRDAETWSKRRLRVDGALAASALLFISWVLVVRPLGETSIVSPLGQGVQTAYPVLDVLVAAMAFAVVPRVREDARTFLNFCGFGLVLVAVSDSGIALQVAQDGQPEFGWPDLVVQVGLALAMTGAVVGGRLSGTPNRQLSRRGDDLLVYVPVLVSVAVAVGFVATGGEVRLGEAAVVSLVALALVIRQLLLDQELRVISARHRYASRHDSLTGLANRSAYVEALATRLSWGGGQSVAVVFADLDGFKQINDSLGHDMGDQVLRQFASQLESVAGDHMAARLGGNEFAILVTGEDADVDAKVLGVRLLRLDLSPERPLVVTCSVGVAGAQSGDSPSDVLRRADLAMYAAKRSGQHSISLYDEAMGEAFDRRSLMLVQLPGAIERGEMRLVFQPLFGLADGRLMGAETLLRWRHPSLGDVPPDEFIRLAEDSGEIVSIGAWVLGAALDQLADWQRQGRTLPQLFVNAAATEFDDTLPGRVLAQLQAHGVPPERLILEVTENQIIATSVAQQTQRLRAAGVRIALDDFGSGYSSLAQLATLPVDVLKVDRGFILSLAADSGRQVLDTVVTLAKSLNLLTVAEGVETLSQAEAARATGVDLVQGFLFSRPLPAEELFALLPAMPAAVSRGGEDLAGRPSWS